MRALRRRKIRQRERLFIAEGVRLVEDLFGSELTVRQAFTSPNLESSARGRLLLETILAGGVGHREISDVDFARVAETESPQGVLAIAEIPDWSLADLRSRLSDPSVVLVLDAVQDPGNFGTLARTAEALGATGLVALPGTVDAWNPKAVRSAVGSTFRIPIVPAGWDELAPWFMEHLFIPMAAAVDGMPLSAIERSTRVGLIVGNEGAGISDEARANANCVVGIPLRGRAESLNVSAAAAILLYELLR